MGCLLAADAPGRIELPASLPLASPAPGQIGARVREALATGAAQPALERALGRAQAEDVRSEALEVFGELFDLMHANRHRIKLLDRCMDHPELADLWQTEGRESSRRALARYIAHRIESGHFRPLANLRLAARIVLETCATWAVHIHWDRAPEPFDPDEARETILDFLVHGLLAQPGVA
jgi:hypothetical protein